MRWKASSDKWHGIMEFIPICRRITPTWDSGFVAVQIYGGYGATTILFVVLDLKIDWIYEGTNGIQSLT